MSKLIIFFQVLKFGGSLILLLSYCNHSFSQNLISNPDFGQVTVQYLTRKIVRPINWYAFEGSRPQFAHPAMKETEFPPARIVKGNGIIYLEPQRYDLGIFTKLLEPLKKDKEYIIAVDFKRIRVGLNSDWRRMARRITNAETGIELDSAELDYNYPVDLVAFFSEELPRCEMKSAKHYVVIDVPDEEQLPFDELYYYKTRYCARGGEQYFGIGLCNPAEYLAVLNDSIDYTHKWSKYAFYGVGIFQVPEKIQRFNVSFTTNYAHLDVRSGSRFTIQNINFEYNRFNLSDNAKTELSAFAIFLQQNNGYNVRIEGHTDTVGTVYFNQRLSERRAKSVYDYLVGLGVARERLSFEGKGELYPLESDEQLKNLGVNRRVEFELVDSE